MNCQSLYEDFKWKNYKINVNQHTQQSRLKELSELPKPITQSNHILRNKLMNELQKFQDEQLLNLEGSIPLLTAAGVLHVLTSISKAKQLMNSNDSQNNRLKYEAKFIYYLWKMLDEEEVEAREIKEVLIILHHHKIKDAVNILRETFNKPEDIIDLLESWRMLNQDKHYYNQNAKMQTHKPKFTYKSTKELVSAFSDQKGENSPNPSTHNIHVSKNRHHQLTVEKTKQLVSRLYKPQSLKVKEQLKNQREQERMKSQLEQCTFKPQLEKRSQSVSKTVPIKGYQKTVGRLRVANEKTQAEKQLRNHKPVGENYEKLRQKGINPPKFLSRQKQQGQTLFVIQFDIGRHKVKVKVRPQDNEESIAAKLCKIYSLKQQYHEQIANVVRLELQNYYNEQQNQGYLRND